MDNDRPHHYAVAELVDKLVELRHSLLPVCHDTSMLPPDARRVVHEVCKSLLSVSTELIRLLDPSGASKLRLCDETSTAGLYGAA
jgi:hypothetical protein